MNRRLISIVIPCYNEQHVLTMFWKALRETATLIERTHRVEIIFVDDGSTDDTWSILVGLASLHSGVRAISLSRNFGHQRALACGFDLSQGDAIVSLDADLQDPPAVIPRLIQEWENGADVVHAVRVARRGEARFKIWTAHLFCRLMRSMGANVALDAGDFRLLSRRSLNALNSMREERRFIRGMVGWIGFPQASVLYTREPRAAGTSGYSITKMAQLALDGIIGFSHYPLRLAFVFSATLAALFFGSLAYAPGDGWMAMGILTMLGVGALNLFCVGILGEYIVRLTDHSKSRPAYLVRAQVGESETGGDPSVTKCTCGERIEKARAA